MSRTYDYLMEHPGSTIADIVHAMNISEDKVRYQIKKEGDVLIKDDGRPAKYSVNPEYLDPSKPEESYDASLLEEKPKTKVNSKRVLMNPQPVINKMIATAKEAGVKMEYIKAERTWYFEGGRGERDELQSKELPKIREFGFEKWLGDTFK